LKGSASKPVQFFDACRTTWLSLLTSHMSVDQLKQAKEAWALGSVPLAESHQLLSLDERTAIENMCSYMRDHLKWKIEFLHDACLSVGACPPSQKTLISYFQTLHRQCHSAHLAGQPQNKKSHVKANYVQVIHYLQQGGRNLGGVTGTKQILAERLANILRCVIQAGSRGEALDRLHTEIDNQEYEEFAGSSSRTTLRRTVQLAALPSKPGSMPVNANVDAAMAESSLGWNLNDAIDDDMLETVDADTTAEENMLRGVSFNPPELDYTCLAPEVCLLSDSEAASIGLSKQDRQLGLDSLQADSDRFQTVILQSIQEQRAHFVSASAHASIKTQHDVRRTQLDPTQQRVYKTVKTWAERYASSPPLRCLVLGTAGTGKTFTLRCAVEAARLVFNTYDSVLLVAHTGVAAANMGGGAATINSVFKLTGKSLDDDLDGDKLNELVDKLALTKLVVIDEISTVGAAQFEMISRSHSMFDCLYVSYCS
jgi:hypothetical protein